METARRRRLVNLELQRMGLPWEPTMEMGVVEGGGAVAEGARWLLLLLWVDLAFCTGNASAVWKDMDRDEESQLQTTKLSFELTKEIE